MKGVPGFSKIFAYGNGVNYRFIAIELMGPSLLSLFKSSQKQFTLPTVLKLGADIIERLKVMHDNNFVHCDLKPDNVTVGIKNQAEFYLIDYGLSRTLEDGKSVKIDYVAGTFEFLSLGAHECILSFKNDLESLLIMLVYLLLKGKLPWNADVLKNVPKKKWLSTVLRYKQQFFKNPPHYLPCQLRTYMFAVQKMSHEDRPNHDILRDILL